MARVPVITGVGLVTPLGVGVDATWASLVAGNFVSKTGVVPVARDGSLSRVAQLGVLAAQEARAGRELDDVAIVVGTSKGPADEWLRDPTTASGLSTLSDEIAARLPFATSPRLTLSAACASGLHALTRAVMLLEDGNASSALVIASESSLHPIWHGTFKRLGVLPPPGDCCRPFDTGRRGFLISEAAAAILLQYREPRPGDLVVSRAIIAADTTHLTSSDPDATSLRHVLARLREIGGPIDFVHAHATATASDAIELAAIQAVFGDERPDVYSHKGAIGHTLGASGLVALSLSTLVHRRRQRPPMMTTRGTIDDAWICPAARSFGLMRSSVVLASGFGGAVSGARLDAL